MENELQTIARHTKRAPVDLESMFADLGVDYREEPIWTGESGWIERNGDQYRVVVNEDEPEPRRRFTAAHELAHYLLHRDLMDHGSRMNRHVDRLFDNTGINNESLFKSSHEVQANRLAAQIVMPAPLVRERLADGLSTSQLAREFRVSKAAMEIRLKTLGLVN